jgi:hypothetical protein
VHAFGIEFRLRSSGTRRRVMSSNGTKIFEETFRPPTLKVEEVRSFRAMTPVCDVAVPHDTIVGGFLSAFGKLEKRLLPSSCLPVLPSVRAAQLGSQSTDFHEI